MGDLNGFKKKTETAIDKSWLSQKPFITAFLVGIVPCPGVVMLMLFSISLKFTGLGVFLGLYISAGMASTITLIVLAGMSGKSAVLKLSGCNTRLQGILSHTIETISGLIVASLGFILLFACL